LSINIERNSLIEQAIYAKFDEQIRLKIGPRASADDFKELNIEETPTYDSYEDDYQSPPEPPPEEMEPTLKVSDKFLNADLQLRVIERVSDLDGNVLGREHHNLILDRHRYRVRFDDGDVTELTVNVIAETMYAEYDADGNQHILLGSIIDHKSSKNAVSFSDQKIIRNGKAHARRSTAGWKLCCEW